MTTKTLITLTLSLLILLAACSSEATSPASRQKGKAAKLPFVMKETIVTGSDTGMIRFVSGRRSNVFDLLSQHWELAHASDASHSSLVLDEKGENIFPELNLFNDSTYTQDPRSKFQSGTWQVKYFHELPAIVLHPTNGKGFNYIIVDITNLSLKLGILKADQEPEDITLSSDGLIHQNKYNDPFHPVNNQWRIKPTKPESDSAILARTKAAVKFYALFYRDNIKRKKMDFSTNGFPEIFTWYNRAIALPNRADISSTWINCYYNKEQALKAHALLKNIMDHYKFEWPDNAPDWRYDNLAILEQMYNQLQ